MNRLRLIGFSLAFSAFIYACKVQMASKMPVVAPVTTTLAVSKTDSLVPLRWLHSRPRP
ncbi:hypothetical protein [Spirosoma telluris]|uniref:hypothetical protein n=1 Tax=Spirosoma telluris TaxID=2183553 RepID=UPI002FC397BD